MNAHHTCSLLAAALILASGYAFAQTPTPAPAAPTAAAAGPKMIGVPTNRRYSTALIVLNAKGGRLEGDKLILDGVQPTATLFTSRPARTVGHMATPEMVEIWRTGSFAKDPPNATASVFSKDGSSVADVVVVLKAAKLEARSSPSTCRCWKAASAKADGPASVFIDTLWWGVAPTLQYYGTSQTTGGETPRSAIRTAPARSAAGRTPRPPSLRAAPRDYGTAVGAPPPPELDPRIQQRYNQPTCGKPPLLPCY